MARQLKVLQVATTGITFKALLMPLVHRLQAEGYVVHMSCADGAYTRQLMEQGYRITPVSVQRRVTTLSNLKAIWQLYRLMRRERFDIVHVHTPVAAVVGRIAAKLARAPVIIYTAHGFYFHDHTPPRARRLIVGLERTLGRISDMLMTQSGEDAATAVREGICPASRVRWIGNGVDVRRFSASPNVAKASSGIPDEQRVVGFVGRMVGEKGIVELVDAMEQVTQVMPEARLMLVGDTLDDDRDRQVKEVIRQKLSRNGLSERVIFTGFVDDVPAALAAMDVFVLPSHREGMPRTIIEAMASGKPVVATNIRGCREEVVHGETGLLAPVNDAGALARAILHILSDPDLAARMGQAGRKRAEEHFDEEMVLDRQMEIYRELVHAKLAC